MRNSVPIVRSEFDLIFFCKTQRIIIIIITVRYLEGFDVHTVEHPGVVVATNINDQVTPVLRFERVHRVKKEKCVRHVLNGRKLFTRLTINQSESRLKTKFFFQNIRPQLIDYVIVY